MVEDDKTFEQQMAAILEEIRLKKQMEEQEIVDEENIQQDINQQNQQLNDEQQAEQEQSNQSTVPSWMTNALEIGLKFESAFGLADSGLKEKLLDGLKDVLHYLENSKLIKGFEDTINGIKVMFEGAKEMFLDLKNEKVTMQGFNLKDNPMETAFSLLKSIGTNSVDVSGVKDEGARFNTWKEAQENNISVKGLDPKEEAAFQNKAAAQGPSSEHSK